MTGGSGMFADQAARGHLRKRWVLTSLKIQSNLSLRLEIRVHAGVAYDKKACKSKYLPNDQLVDNIARH